MANNPFKKSSTPDNHPNRNTSDLSHVKHLTMPIGALIPAVCLPVIPGDSFRINTSFGFRFMPTMFPIQSGMRGHLHYFYVRSRNLYDDWKDFYSGTKQNLVRPVIKGTDSQYKSMFTTGSIGDYLCIPTTVLGSSGSFDNLVLEAGFYSSTASAAYSNFSNVISSILNSDNTPSTSTFGSFDELFTYYNNNPDTNLNINVTSASLSNTTSSALVGLRFSIGSTYIFNNKNVEILFSLPVNDSLYNTFDVLCFSSDKRVPSNRNSSILINSKATCIETNSDYSLYRIILTESPKFSNFSSNIGVLFSRGSVPLVPYDSTPYGYFISDAKTNNSYKISKYYPYPVDLLDTVPISGSGDSGHMKPYGSSEGQIPIIAEPFRAYEQIYNYFYRDERNNPFIINGEPEYQKFLEVTSGGEDSYPYKLHYRNWGVDMFTGAVPSPQMGLAPLVGITSNGTATFSDPDTGKEYQVMMKSTDGDHVDGVEYLENVPKSVARSLVNVVSSGISINDFRNVNAYQRYLETSLRKGYKYQDQISGHYGVSVRYDELDAPEFLGGVSRAVQVSQVNQTSPYGDDPLGSYAGQAYLMGDSKFSVTHYFDEPGFLIGIFCVVPETVYSQTLPKFFTKTNRLDLYTPEFGKIGYQEIKDYEVNAISSYARQSKELVSSYGTFGYQRPWYEYLSVNNTVHGEFRTSLRDFVIQRNFGEVPSLGGGFTVINPASLNNVFSVETSHPILGLISFDIKSKRPIPKSGIASLE
ncbi:major capsid protein [Sigmofec virus UA08Rod_4527]|uniref:Major capsid protein n=1 Tax=Sigmofec virus UA08Rod_4527 TaxID=2929403 RepID=A0A976N1Q9_9VIRU|nr:major capsid protein [Sigmofec virus UA08Rod_4527]